MGGFDIIEDEPPFPAAREVLGAVAAELDRTEPFLEQLEDVLVALIQTTEFEISAGQKSKLQEIDLLSQTLRGLANYLRDVSSELSETVHIDTSGAIEGLSLAAMRKRLDCSADAKTKGSDTGEVIEMF